MALTGGDFDEALSLPFPSHDKGSIVDEELILFLIAFAQNEAADSKLGPLKPCLNLDATSE